MKKNLFAKAYGFYVYGYPEKNVLVYIFSDIIYPRYYDICFYLLNMCA